TLERGSARVTVDLSSAGDTQTAAVDAWLSDLAARNAARAFTLRDPASLSARATRSPTGFNVQTLAVKTAALDLKGSGALEKGLTATGRFDLAALQAEFRDLVDFGGLELAGRGSIAADYRRGKPAAGQGKAQAPTYVARTAAEVRGLKVVG